ncbi:MAG: CPBP family intramembrane metalloprotease [Saprospiraceae bacterium]|nr:CPBP family intramembrane metalloprotease [Saprospiraceae bacterium]MBK8634202.1 CPBP family intramembrane metalloprotease [Saprospiraceae bacterium]MBP7642896.1 CPBP family intramembrane metalloprotease [Saprospiraceae bacterium]
MKEIKDNIQILVIMTIINIFVIWNYISNDKTLHGIGYFLFFYVSILTIHLFTKRVPPKNEIEVKEPKKELTIAVFFAFLGLLFLALNFMLKSNVIPDKPITKIPIGLGSIIFAMPLAIFIYLLSKRYSLMNLGLRTKPLTSMFLGLIIWSITGLFAYVFNKDGILWARAYDELGGIIGIIVTGVIGAALFEEFSRFVIQSRFERIFMRPGISILFATTIWSFMHFPVTYFKGSDVSGTLVYCIQIIPIGFIWGYLTQRTKSIIPATIAHGFNLWGFQNG